MTYQVKKAGRVYYTTVCEIPPYPRAVEKSIQAAGYEIYIDGRKIRR